VKSWAWHRVFVDKWKLLDGRGRERATVWRTMGGEYVWHTWGVSGVGGENSGAPTLVQAKDEAVAAVVRQGWAPGGWKVEW
jgi:hypothetical protein